MSRLYISICRRPMTRTVPGTHTRDLSLRSTSVHMVNSDSSFKLFSSSRMASASLSGSPVRRAGNRTGLHAAVFHAHEHFGGRADQLLVAKLQEELIRARAGFLDALEEF